MAKTIQELQSEADRNAELARATVDRAAGLARSADEVVTDTNVTTITDIIKTVGQTVDTDSAIVACALLNTFNLAVQKLGGRSAWTPRDFMAYGVALSAMQQVAADAPDDHGQYAGSGQTLR